MELPVVHPLDVHYRDLDSTDGQLAILGHYLHLDFEAGLGGVQAAADFPVQEPAPGGPVREGPRIIRVKRGGLIVVSACRSIYRVVAFGLTFTSGQVQRLVSLVSREMKLQ